MTDPERPGARQLARRLRHYGVLRVFQQFELTQGIALPDGGTIDTLLPLFTTKTLGGVNLGKAQWA